MAPMSYDPTSHLLLTPEDARRRPGDNGCASWASETAPVPEFDDFARQLARVTGAPYAMVNFIDEERQYFAGLYAPACRPGRRAGPGGAAALGRPRHGARPRLLPACHRAAQGAGAGGRLRLSALRGEPRRRRDRHPLLSRRAADRPYGHGAGHGLRRRPGAPAVGEAGAGDDQVAWPPSWWTRSTGGSITAIVEGARCASGRTPDVPPGTAVGQPACSGSGTGSLRTSSLSRSDQ